MTDRESAWKELIERDCERALAFFWSDVHAELDWARDVESKEQEFRKTHPKAVTGKRIVDKLLKAYHKATGDPRFLHVEIQGKRRRDFRRRVYVYNYRAEDYCEQPVASLVLLTDEHPDWRPRGYRASVLGTTRILTFRTVKLLDFRGKEAELEGNPNPVGLFVVAHLEGQRLGKNYPEVAKVKRRLIQNVRGRGMEGPELDQWYVYFDWLLPLDEEYDQQVWDEITRVEGRAVPTVSYLERRGLAEGLAKGRREVWLKVISDVLKSKYAQQGTALFAQIEKIEDSATLEAIYHAMTPTASLDDVRKLIPLSEQSPPA